MGAGYLAGTGISLIVVLIWIFVINRQPDFTAFVGTTTVIILSLALIYLAYWLIQSELGDEHIWSVALWGAIGLMIPTIPILGMVVLGLDARIQIDSSILANIAAASAIIGALFGAVTELEDEHIRVLKLNRRNVVLNRIIRHDVRNDASLLLWFANRLEEEFAQAGNELADPIRRKTEEIIEISDIARQVEALEEDNSTRPINVVEVVDELVKTVESTHPTSEIETKLPDEAWVEADELLKTVLDNLVENAIEHNDQTPQIEIAVNTPDSINGNVEVCVRDNGPGISDEAIEVLCNQAMPASPDSLPSISLGLWLVKWIVDSYDGKLSIEKSDARGTKISFELPKAWPEEGGHQQSAALIS